MIVVSCSKLFICHRTRLITSQRQQNIEVPVLPGLMPITSAGQVKNIVGMSGTKIPKKLQESIDKYKDSPEDLKKAGIEFTKEQMEGRNDPCPCGSGKKYKQCCGR